MDISVVQAGFEWLSHPALVGLLREFSQDSELNVSENAYKNEKPTQLAHAEQLAASARAWLGEEPFDTRVVDQDAASPLMAAYMVEQAAAYYWNFRAGIPKAVRDAWRGLLQQTGLMGSIQIGGRRLGDVLNEESTYTPLLGRTSDDYRKLLRLYVEDSIVTRIQRGASLVDATALVRQSYSSLGGGESDGSITVEQLQASTRSSGQYRERWNAPQFEMVNSQDYIEYAAAELELTGVVRPKASHYNHVVVLGGGGTTPLKRAEYASMLQASGITSDNVWLLGSPRFLDEQRERALADLYAPGASDEYDLMVAAGAQAFQLEGGASSYICGCDDSGALCPAWLDLHGAQKGTLYTPAAFTHQRSWSWETNMGQRNHKSHVEALSARSGAAGRRPNTADTYDMLATQAKLSRGQTMLIITAQIFVPFQRFDAWRMLTIPYGVDIEVVGMAPADPGGQLGTLGLKVRHESCQALLQELLSAVRSARRLIQAA